MIYLAFRRVHVLDRALLGRKDPSSESHDLAIDGTDREHYPFVELVRNFSGIGAVLLFYGKTQFQKQVFLVPGCNCVFCEGIFLLLGIAELELPDRFVCKAPFPEIG